MVILIRTTILWFARQLSQRPHWVWPAGVVKSAKLQLGISSDNDTPGRQVSPRALSGMPPHCGHCYVVTPRQQAVIRCVDRRQTVSGTAGMSSSQGPSALRSTVTTPMVALQTCSASHTPMPNCYSDCSISRHSAGTPFRPSSQTVGHLSLRRWFGRRVRR